MRVKDGEQISYGLLDEDGMIRLLQGDCPDNFRETGIVKKCPYPLLAPCTPSKIIGTGLNYRDVVLKPGERLPERPKLFIKPVTTLILDGEDVVQPPMVKQLSCEVELAVVIGKKGKNIKISDAGQYIWGYTVANDMTASDLQAEDTIWGRAKSFDTFLPIAPYIVSDIQAAHLKLTSKINGREGQAGNTEDLIRDVPWLISYISHVMTLLPGDIIITGTPSGYGKRVEQGDEMVMEIEKIGSLRNRVTGVSGPYYF